MIYSKRHAKNAVAAKARQRLARLEWDEPASKAAKPRRRRARFTIQIRDNEIGDSLTLNLHRAPWPNVWISEHGQFSSAKIGRVIAEILKAAK